MTRPWARLIARLRASARGLIAASVVAALPLAAGAQGPGPDFDHLTSGFPLTGAHKSARCETCHDKGIFKGTPKTCEACHAPGGRLSSVIEPTTHAPTTQRCDLCHTTVTFVGAKWNHAGAQPGACATCHNGTTAPGKSAGHLQTTQSCDVCHRTSAWTPAGYDHTGIVGGCATCHNGSTALGKSRTHIPTTASCESCHTSTTVFATWTMNHAGIVNGCATCHGGQFGDVVAKPSTHIPTSAACESCHTSTTSFKGAVFDHTGIVNGCTACHNSATATGKPSTHIPTNMSCETCHTSTTAFSAWTMSHAQIVSGCAQCHGGQFPDVTAKLANHVPTNQPCEVCHSATSFATFGGGTMNHTGITSGCATCHAAGSSFFGVTVKTPPATHIPFGGAACETCHSPGNFTAFSGTPMNHAPVAGISCATCHETGKSWFGVTIVTRPTPAQDPNHPTTGDCGTCHTTTTFNGAVGKPANHLPTTQPCSLCHSNPSDYSVGTMNHTGIVSGCATCHAPGSSFANVIPVVPPPTHFPTPMPCETCHAASNFTTFGGTAMNHAGITANCANCHAPGKSFFGVTMKTPPATHFPTPMPCETCHVASNFTSFAGTAMNHAGITANCATCHAAGSSFFGVTMKTPPATHIPFGGATCEACHAPANFTSFGGTPMNHAAVSGLACTTCHETGKTFFGVTIVTRPTPAQDPNHPTTGDCGSCHTTATFNGAVGKPPNHLPTNQPCALCHSNPSDYSVGTMNHAGIASGCATCHAPGSSFANIVPKTPPATHFPTPMPCETCHVASNFTSFAGTAMNHAGITANCATCHAAGSSFFGVTMKTPPATHIPFGGATCEACHAPANFTSFGGTPMNHAAVSGLACTTCHETGKTFFGVTIVTRPTPAQDPNHPTTGDCGSCHTTATFNGAVGKPPNHLPTNQPCALCHSNPSDYSVGTMNHAGIASGCATCHAPGSSFANIVPKTPPATHFPTPMPCETCHVASNFTSFAGTAMNHAGITANCATCHAAGSSFFGVTMKTPPATHIPFGGATCEACHAPANFTSFGGTPMNHAAVSGLACTTCHETGKTFFGVTIVTRPTPAQDPNHPTTGDCGSCHTTATFNGAVGKPPNHLPTNQPCALCHSNPSDYSVGTMNHAGIASGCATCHAPGSSFANIVPKTPPATHFPTPMPCETCHVASNFTSFAGTAMNHAGITANCATCHAAGSSFFGVTMKTPPATHIPFGGATCEACHAPANFTSFGGTPMNHAAVSGLACTTCHETGKTFFGVTIVTRPTPAQDPNHPTTGDCGSCHTTATFNGAVGKPPNHLPTNQPCALCHSNPSDYSVGTMNHAGIASGCATCHATGSSFANVVPKTPPANHIPTSKPCETCHAASNFTSFAGTTMNHAGITSGCSTCHAAGLSFFGVSVKAPPPTHIPFGGAACEACHAPANFASFAGTPMNHSAVTSMKCVSCHELGMTWFGVHIVTRPGANHNPGQDCGACHTTSSFDSGDALLKRKQAGSGTTTAATAPGQTPRGARPADAHLGIAAGSCATCHNGSAARSKPARHLVTTLSCDACHRTTTWSPASFTHAATAPGTCMTCHNAVLAKGRAASHFVTVRSCDACHRTLSWTSVRYQHVSPAYRQHGPGVGCNACHKSNAEAVVWTSPAFKPDCAGCHADRFRPQQHPKPGLGGGLHTLVELRDCAGSCHLGSGPAKAPKTFASRHRPSDGGF